MKLREYIILVAVIVASGAYLFLRNNDRSQYQLPALAKVTGEKISRVDISSSGKSVELTRSDDQWRIGEKQYPADETKVKAILTEIEGLKLTALVSEAKAYARYDLTDEKKITVKAWAGSRLVRNFDIGKTADTYRHTFVRIGDNPNVYHAQNDFRRTFDQTVETLRDKTALSFNTSDITRFEIFSDGKNQTFSLKAPPAQPKKDSSGASDQKAPGKAAPVWLTEEGKPVETEAVERFLSQLGHLTCNGYINDKQKDDFKAPVFTVTLVGGQTYTLSVFEKQASDKTYPSVSSQNDYPFMLNESTWGRLKENREKLLDTKKTS